MVSEHATRWATAWSQHIYLSCQSCWQKTGKPDLLASLRAHIKASVETEMLLMRSKSQWRTLA